MRFVNAITTLAASFAGFSAAQQYLGDTIANSLPSVPGAEITYFRIPDPSGKNNNLTLINYYSLGTNGKPIVESNIERAVVVIHGLQRDPGTYEANMLSALSQVDDSSINANNVVVMAPYFPNGDDKNVGYPWTDGLKAGRGSTSNALVWSGSQWSAGGNNQYPYTSTNTSSYTVLDTIIQYFDNKALFPNMKQIVISGHSLGAQTVQRYVAIGQPGATSSPVTYWIGNPNSYVWLSTTRPLSTASCSIYDVYREGYTNFTEYPMTYGTALVASGRTNILANYQSKQIAYARGTLDLGDDSDNCAPETTGANRNERFFNFIAAFPPSCTDPSGDNCDTVDLVDVGHDAGEMFASAAGLARLFTDNYNGNGSRAYDFGYPREAYGDDPYPNPALSSSTTTPTNNNTYAGNKTYYGCWSDQTTRSLVYEAYDETTNTIELCATTCTNAGYSIAGLEYGSQCFCGNSLTSEATEVLETSCTQACAGNSSEICGGSDRLSIFSDGKPTVSQPPSDPATVGSWSYVDCYTEATSGRALAGASTSGSSMTLEYCANFCSSYTYFGTEYGDECYCGNSFAAGSVVATSTDCDMLCANDITELCGAGNRLSVYKNNDVVASSSASAATSTTSTAGGSTSTGTSPSCPGSNSTTVTSNGETFLIECGIDHQAGDLTSVTVSSFEACIDACATNSACVDVSLSGSACYLKSSLGADVYISTVWGAKLVTSGSSSSVSASISSPSSSSASSTLASLSSISPASSSSAITTTAPSSVSCPGSNNTVYTAASGHTFLIECGIDHQAGDMGSTTVSSFADCIVDCDSTSGCVDVSLSGAACYLKSTLGAAVSNSGVWGAKLIISASSSVTTAVQASVSVSSSSVGVNSATSASSTFSTSTKTSSTSSGSATASLTAVSCPSSNNTIYTANSGQTFLIECGIDHQSGDLSSTTVSSFAGCIAACDSTADCVDVSLSGVACYLKKSVGADVYISNVWGARLVNETVTA